MTDAQYADLLLNMASLHAKLDLLLRPLKAENRSANAERQRRFREKHRNKAVTPEVTHTTGIGNGVVTLKVTPLNGNAVAYIPVIGGGEFGVSKELLAELEIAYPLVDGLATLKQIRAWCVTNPNKRKTSRGVTRFINGWFEKDQNRG